MNRNHWKRTYLVLAIALLSLVALASGLEAAPKVIQLAGMNPVDYPATKQMFVLKDIFDKGTEGRYEIRVFPGNQLGDYTQVYEEVMRGSIDMALITVPSQFDKRLELIFFPYICNSYDNISQYFSQGQFLYSTMERVHAALGVKLLGFSVEGLSGIGSTKPAQSPGDPAVGKGVLLRMAPIDAIKFGGMALGFQTMSLPYAEVYTALQTGIIDAYEVGPATLAYMNYKDLTKQYYQYNNYMECNQWIINKNLFDSMSPEDQKLLLENIAKFQEESIAQAKANETEYADEMKKAGIEVVSFTPEELDLLAKHVRQEAWPKLRDQITPEIYDELIKIYQEK